MHEAELKVLRRGFALVLSAEEIMQALQAAKVDADGWGGSTDSRDTV